MRMKNVVSPAHGPLKEEGKKHRDERGEVIGQDKCGHKDYVSPKEQSSRSFRSSRGAVAGYERGKGTKHHLKKGENPERSRNVNR